MPLSALGGVFFLHPGAKRRKKRTHRQTEQNDQAAEGRDEWWAWHLTNTHDRLAGDALARRPGPQRSGGHLPPRGSGQRSRVAPPCISVSALLRNRKGHTGQSSSGPDPLGTMPSLGKVLPKPTSRYYPQDTGAMCASSAWSQRTTIAYYALASTSRLVSSPAVGKNCGA